MEIRQARATLAAHIAEQDAEIAHMRTQQAAVWRYLQSVSPWSESNDMDWADEIICGIDGLRIINAEAAVTDARVEAALDAFNAKAAGMNLHEHGNPASKQNYFHPMMRAAIIAALLQRNTDD